MPPLYLFPIIWNQLSPKAIILTHTRFCTLAQDGYTNLYFHLSLLCVAFTLLHFLPSFQKTKNKLVMTLLRGLHPIICLISTSHIPYLASLTSTLTFFFLKSNYYFHFPKKNITISLEGKDKTNPKTQHNFIYKSIHQIKVLYSRLTI